MAYIPTIGLEIHAQLKTKTKMFCGCSNDSLEHHPNVNICPICMAHPGVLPTINKKAVEAVIKVGLALGSEISKKSKFDRKNYFYPDIPKGYQISQYNEPICFGGWLSVKTATALEGEKKIRIRRVHLEEDTARLSHSADGKESFVDFNRAGVPLMELVSEPDIRTSEEAKNFCSELQMILRYLEVSDADMEKGEMRCEANVSLSPSDSQDLGVKVEIKNLNSFRSVEKAIEYEIKRQSLILDKGEKVTQETRGWDENKNKTFSQRSKEEARDYRYLPEPDLPPMVFSLGAKNGIDIEKIRLLIPELPREKFSRFKKEYGLEEYKINFLFQDREAARYFEEVVSEANEWLKNKKNVISRQDKEQVIQLSANYIMTDLWGMMKARNGSFNDILITPENFAEFITLIQSGEISSKIAKIVLEEMLLSGSDPSHVIEAKNLKQITDKDALSNAAKKVIEENQNATADFLAGKEASLQFLLGMIMKDTKSKADPKAAKEALVKLLNKMK